MSGSNDNLQFLTHSMQIVMLVPTCDRENRIENKINELINVICVDSFTWIL